MRLSLRIRNNFLETFIIAFIKIFFWVIAICSIGVCIFFIFYYIDKLLFQVSVIFGIAGIALSALFYAIWEKLEEVL
jgi:hypothetical protein